LSLANLLDMCGVLSRFDGGLSYIEIRGSMMTGRKKQIARSILGCCWIFISLWGGPFARAQAQQSGDALERGFQSPPPAARLRCYWWWLNGHTTKATITRDLEQMANKGYGGALLVDANGSNQEGNENVSAGPEFDSPAWTALYVHALREAHRLGIEITLNIASGWNLGGPQVQPEDAMKLLTWSRTVVTPVTTGAIHLAAPPLKNGFYRQIAVLAYPLRHGLRLAGQDGDSRKPIAELALKSAAIEAGISMPNTDRLLTPSASTPDEQDADLAEVHDISSSVDPDATLHWTPPAGDRRSWEILRIGYTDSNARVSTSSGAWQGLAIDYLDPAALDRYWQQNVKPLLVAGRPYLGNTLKYVATDSWELGGTNWTGNFRNEFRRRHGYDPVLYLPVVAGRIIDSRELSTKFLADLRRTVGDLVTGHYDHMAQLAKQYGLGIECESGGPHGAPIDALETFRSSAVPQAEFWAMSKDHRFAEDQRYFVKEAASASHIYGHPLVADEGMTSIGNQWNESIGMNLKPTFDYALTEGMNRLVWHEFASSPPQMGMPGQEYFAGTHLNPNVTWWRDAGPFLRYLNRAQFLMQMGQPINDVLYYYGDQVPNFVRLKSDDPARVLPGFDYDVTDTDALLHRMILTSPFVRTPEGITYRILALPATRILPLSVLEWVDKYLQAGGTVVGKRPLRSQGIVSAADAARFASIANQLWSTCEHSSDHHARVSKGELFCSDSTHQALGMLGVPPDVESPSDRTSSIDYVHRRVDDTDIYFIRNTHPQPLQTNVTLRVAGKQPEIFDAVTGEIHDTLLFAQTPDHRTTLPMSLGPYGSVFLIFLHPAAKNSVTSITHNGAVLYAASQPELPALPEYVHVNSESGSPLLTASAPGDYKITTTDGKTYEAVFADTKTVPIAGPWTLSFPQGWGAPKQIQLDHLASWTSFEDPGIRYFSGTATYRTKLNMTASQLAADHWLRLNLGEVHDVAAVRINGQPAQILWKSPYSLSVGKDLHPGENIIEIDVTNLWPNRLIGDAQSTTGKHYTWTNIRMYTKDSPLLPSGLMGPVTLEPIFRCPLR